MGGDAQSGTVRALLPQPITIRVIDRLGAPIAGQAVAFSITAGGGTLSATTAVTSADGAAETRWTLGPIAGVHSLVATLSGATPVTFNAVATASGSGTPSTVVASAGRNQAVLAGQVAPVSPSVLVRDDSGKPVPGVTVSFEVTAGGGSAVGATATTDVRGIASVASWLTGGTAGVNTMRATVADVGSVQFTVAGCEATGGSGYEITICYRTPISASQRQAFVAAAARWRSGVTSDFPSLSVNVPEGSCDAGSPSIDMTIRDLLIFVAIESIDGPGGILGAAGWCFRRAGSVPVVGLMRFDSADLSALENSERAGAVILHEMGHVLGVGTMWSTTGLLQNPSSASLTLDTFFNGPSAIAGFDQIGGATYSGGQKVPIENVGGSGTINSHWRKSVLSNELMTGFLSGGPTPLSVVTIRSLEDLGYTVNPSAADPFFISGMLGRLMLPDPGAVPLEQDVYVGAQWTIDPKDGRIVRMR